MKEPRDPRDDAAASRDAGGAPRDPKRRKRPLAWLAGLTWPRGTAARFRRWLTGSK